MSKIKLFLQKNANIFVLVAPPPNLLASSSGWGFVPRPSKHHPIANFWLRAWCFHCSCIILSKTILRLAGVYGFPQSALSLNKFAHPWSTSRFGNLLAVAGQTQMKKSLGGQKYIFVNNNFVLKKCDFWHFTLVSWHFDVIYLSMDSVTLLLFIKLTKCNYYQTFVFDKEVQIRPSTTLSEGRDLCRHSRP